MKHSKIKITVIYLVMPFLFMSCWNNAKEEGFYEYSRISYIYRLPVIEPYEITSPDNGANWTITFKNNPSSIHDGAQFLTKIGIHDSIFIVYSPRDLSFSSDHPQVWALIDIPKKEEKVFTSEKDYKVYLRAKGIEDLKLHDINALFIDFDKNKRLPPEWPNK